MRMATDQPARKSTPPLRWVGIALTIVAILGLLVAIAVSPVPMRGAEVFGAIANKIKGHPGMTAAVIAVAIVSLWTGVGALVAAQEWPPPRRVRAIPARR